MASPKTHGHIMRPSRWIERFADRVPAGAAVLDLACGGGRHGRVFLDRGHPVAFVDVRADAVADLAGGAGVEIIETDLESGQPWPLAERRFGAVLVANYLWRPIMAGIVGSVAAGGILLYETFAEGNEAYGRPRNPDHLLRAGELLEAVRGRLDVLAYEQREHTERRPRVVQRIAARRPS